MLIDGSKEASKRIKSMLFWDVNNGIARRNWARNEEATFAIKRAMKNEKKLKITIPNKVDLSLFNNL
jgi:urocanate hydratase